MFDTLDTPPPSPCWLQDTKTFQQLMSSPIGLQKAFHPCQFQVDFVMRAFLSGLWSSNPIAFNTLLITHFNLFLVALRTSPRH